MATIVKFPSARRESIRRTGFADRLGASYTLDSMSTQVERTQKIEAQFRIGDWLVAPSLNRVMRDGVAVQLSFKAMDLLISLADRAGEVVDKRELVDLVWQTEYVADNTLTRRIAELREAFEDDARNPRYIETIPKRGYRMIAEVHVGDTSTAQKEALSRPEPVESSPYPGLEPFTESDADVFFGRESEIAALWRKIAGRRLLAVIGPSGAGKSSLIRAGVIARAPPGWRAVHCQPGEEPFLALARALAPDLAGDAGEMRQLLAFHDPDIALAVCARWRGRWDEALVVVDQFEELFTLNPETVQARFVDLLRRLVDAAGIHLVLVLRDDFLFECQRFPGLAPVFADLTPVGPLARPGLRQALIEPAASRLHAFESETLVDEMVNEVEDERGALPLLAFAVSRLWELRDHERRMLTSEAYETIGGVGGALAQHAEATLEAIGVERLPIVRELFRNLVTAQGTRAVREVGDLLSVFDGGGERGGRAPPTKTLDRTVRAGGKPAGEIAEEVLRQLIDARLLTSFEEATGDEAAPPPNQRVEIVHESLLRAWPRLVRWQTQDADAAQLRDQLRQAARLWQERGRPTELLWIGTPYRELRVWQESYPGGLTATEQAFVDAMIHQASRRRRRRRIIGVAVVAFLVAVAAALAGLWLRSEHQARRIEARRIEEIAAQTMGKCPQDALAYALASLEIMDSREARRLALEAVWSSPMPLSIGDEERPAASVGADFSPDGKWLLVGHWKGSLALWPRDGGSPSFWKPYTDRTRGYFTPDSTALLSSSTDSDAKIDVWSVPGLQRIGNLDRRMWQRHGVSIRRASVVRSLSRIARDPKAPGGWRFDLRARDRCGELPGDRLPAGAVLQDGSGFVVALDDELQLRSLDDPGAPPIRLARSPSPVDHLAVNDDGDRMATVHADGTVRLWALEGGAARSLREWPRIRPSACNDLRFHPSEDLLAVGYAESLAAVLALTDPPGSDPLLVRPHDGRLVEIGFSSAGDWLVTTCFGGPSVWPFDRRRQPYVLRGHAGVVEHLAFAPDGRWLLSQGADGTIRKWPIEGAAGSRVRVLHNWGHPTLTPGGWLSLSRDGRLLLTTCNEDAARVVPLDGSPSHSIGGFDGRVTRGAIDGAGRLVAVPGRSDDRWIVRILDLESGTLRDIDLSEIKNSGAMFVHLQGTRDGRFLLTGSKGALHELDPATGVLEPVADGVGLFIIARNDPLIVSRTRIDGVSSVATIHDLAAGTATPLASHGNRVLSFALDQSASIVATGGPDGIIRVGPVSGETPHWLVGHDGVVWALAISPDGRTIASGGSDGTIRLWPMPDLTRPPLHDLPRDEFLARLGSLINRHVIRDPDDPEGYRIKVDPFPGWAAVPEW